MCTLVFVVLKAQKNQLKVANDTAREMRKVNKLSSSHLVVVVVVRLVQFYYMIYWFEYRPILGLAIVCLLCVCSSTQTHTHIHKKHFPWACNSAPFNGTHDYCYIYFELMILFFEICLLLLQSHFSRRHLFSIGRLCKAPSLHVTLGSYNVFIAFYN